MLHCDIIFRLPFIQLFWNLQISTLEQGYKVAGLDIKSLENETMEAQSDLQITSASKLPLDRFHFVHADISDPEKIKLAVKEAVEWLGGCIHVLINNAGLFCTTQIAFLTLFFHWLNFAEKDDFIKIKVLEYYA